MCPPDGGTAVDSVDGWMTAGDVDKMTSRNNNNRAVLTSNVTSQNYAHVHAFNKSTNSISTVRKNPTTNSKKCREGWESVIIDRGTC